MHDQVWSAWVLVAMMVVQGYQEAFDAHSDLFGDCCRWRFDRRGSLLARGVCYAT